MKDSSQRRLIEMNLIQFADETASESPAPGGGSISAYIAALGASLGTMVANLSSHKKGWDDKIDMFSNWAEKGQALKDSLLQLVDEDTQAFNKIMDSFGLPKNSDEEKTLRTKAIQDATLFATQVPLRTMKTSFACYELLAAMAQEGNPASVSDAGVGAICIRAAIYGAYLNVKINAVGLKDVTLAKELIQEAEEILASSQLQEIEILKITESKIS
jgi:glutamate formiminotransferase/formiminotetrahydrofolate cyclodeaminase